MQRLWYYEQDGREHGPIASGDLDDLVRAETLSTTTRIREADSENWSRFSRLQDTIRRDAATQPAPPPASLAGVSSSEGFAADQFTSIDSINISGNTDAIEEAARRTTANTLYYCESFGEVMGPMPHRELVMLAGKGIVTGHDRVRRESEADWVPAAELPEIAGALAAHAALGGGIEDSATLTNAGDTTDPDELDQLPGPDHQRESKDRGASNEPAEEVQPRRRKPLSARQKKRRARVAEARQRRREEEERLEEVFSEAFSEDDEPVSPAVRQAPAPPAAAPAEPPTAPSTSAAVDAGTAPPTTTPNPATFAGAAPVPPAAPAFTPPPRPAKPGGHAAGLKTPAMIAATVLLLAAGIWGVTQVSFGSVFGVDVEQVLVKYRTEYEKLSQGTIAPTAWNEFAEAVRADAKVAIDQLRDGGAPEGRDMELLKAATALVQMVNQKVDNESKRQEFWEAFTSALESAG